MKYKQTKKVVYVHVYVLYPITYVCTHVRKLLFVCFCTSHVTACSKTHVFSLPSATSVSASPSSRPHSAPCAKCHSHYKTPSCLILAVSLCTCMCFVLCTLWCHICVAFVLLCVHVHMYVQVIHVRIHVHVQYVQFYNAISGHLPFLQQTTIQYIFCLL